MSSPDPKAMRVIGSLLKKTRAGRLLWQGTSQDGVFLLGFTAGAVKLRTKWNDEVDQPDYIVEFLDEGGDTIDSFSDLDLKEEIEGLHPFKALEELYTLARRQAKGVDKTLDGLLEELEDES